MDEKLLSTVEAAERLGKTRMRVYQMIREGKLKAVRRPGMPALLRESEIVAYVAAASETNSSCPS